MGAYELLDVLRAEGLAAQPPTVYRALDFLVGHGFAHKIERLNAFVACAAPGERHAPAFLICTGCGAVAEMPSQGIARAVRGAGRVRKRGGRGRLWKDGRGKVGRAEGEWAGGAGGGVEQERTLVGRKAPVGPDGVLLGDGLPEPAADLVPRLPGLDVQDLAHGRPPRAPPPRAPAPPPARSGADRRQTEPPRNSRGRGGGVSAGSALDGPSISKNIRA